MAEKEFEAKDVVGEASKDFTPRVKCPSCGRMGPEGFSHTCKGEKGSPDNATTEITLTDTIDLDDAAEQYNDDSPHREG